MKNALYFLIFSFFLCACYIVRSSEENQKMQPVNAVLQDESFEKIYGRKPDLDDSEALRISTHLAYVEQKLRESTPEDLPCESFEMRLKMLNLLAAYQQAGKFPANYDFPDERKPCFIDRDGAICAVGYLIEQTAGRELAEKINDSCQYMYIKDMKMPELEEWIASSGLSEEECAMIQPAYHTRLPDEYVTQNHVPTGYAAASGGLVVLNGLTGVSNVRSIRSGTTNMLAGILGIAGGAASVALGITNLDKGKGEYIGTKINGQFKGINDSPNMSGTTTTHNVYSRNPANTTVSWSNIVTGAASVALGSWNLFATKKSDKSRKCPTVSIAPLPGSGAVIGFAGSF